MNEHGRNDRDILRYTDVEYTPEGYENVYRWDDFLEIAGGNAHNAMDTIDLVSAGGEYEGFDPRYAYTCEFVGCCTLVDGIALFRPVSREQENLIQIAFLRSDIDDDTGAYTERFEAGSFDIAAAADIQCSDLAIDLLEYFEGRSFKGLPDVKRGLDGREAVAAVEGATGCDLGLFDDFWLGSPGETDVRVGPYLKRDLLEFSYISNELSYKYGTSVRDIRKIVTQIGSFRPDHLAAVKAYLDCEYVPDVNMPDEKTYRWGDFLEIAGRDARYAAMLINRTAAGEPEEGLHPETLVDQDIRDGEAFMLAGRPIVPEDVYDPVTPFERSFREDIFNMPQNRPVGLAVLATLPLDAFLDASLSIICRGEGENAGTFTVKPGTYEPIFGIYDPVGGCGGTMGTVLDRDFEIDPHDISYTMMEPMRGEWKSDRIDLYTPQDCFGFSDSFGGRIEYSEKKPKAVVAVKPDPVELGHRASVAAGSTVGDRARGAGIRQ